MPKPPSRSNGSNVDWFRFENAARSCGYQVIAGVDEVGRGCLAGPVYAAAVILPDQAQIPGINDSKKLSAAQREKLYWVIRRQAIAWSVASIAPGAIDEVNIFQASLLAMKSAVEKLNQRPHWVLVDGKFPVKDLDLPQQPIVDGDALSISIAAASILAKVTRDRLMRLYAQRYPAYHFAQNKGYGTPAHREALTLIGPCPIHRRSFHGV